jgi:hypothetical protein
MIIVLYPIHHPLLWLFVFCVVWIALDIWMNPAQEQPKRLTYEEEQAKSRADYAYKCEVESNRANARANWMKKT